MKRIGIEKLFCLTIIVFGLLYFFPQPISADFYVIPVKSGFSFKAKTIQVDCSAGQTISSAIKRANPGDTIQLQGICNETVTLISPNHDRLIIDGLDTAIIDGGGQDVIVINSAQGVMINGLTVQNGKDGIIGNGGSAFTVEDITILDNADEGIRVDESSTAQLKNCTVENSGDAGIGVYHSNVYLYGSILSNNNGGRGIGIFNNSNVSFSGATITTSGNDRGIQAHNSSSLGVFGSTLTTNNNSRGILISNSSSFSSSGSTLTFQNNSSWGLQLVGASSLYTAPDTAMTISYSDRGFQVHGSSYAEITGTLLIENSGNVGILVSQSSGIEIGDPADVTVRNSVGDGVGIKIVNSSSVYGDGGSLIVEENNTDGIRALQNSRIGTGTTFSSQIRNNGNRGLLAVDGSSVNCSNSVITGNAGGDAVLSFGSRASLYGGIIGNISCDGTVLIRGDYACP